MADRSYRLMEIVGTSTEGVDDAIRNGIATVAAEVSNLNWFQVVEIRGHIDAQQVAHTQVTLKVGYRSE
ncbi:MAG: dodecin family protein [Austwickia sp.]|nr:dodecin domain-containing protein [Austwickia sp.]MCO5309976.1 dodecin family protein [Austwickia sp.]